MKKGYARVSTTGQSLELQINTLASSGCITIYSEKASGKHMERPELAKMLKHIEINDVIMVTKLDRIGRSTLDLLKIVKTIKERGAEFKALDSSIDTSTPQGEMFLGIMGVMAQYERALILERTKEGRERAIKQGKHMGRPRNISKRERALLVPSVCAEKGISIQQACDTLGISKRLYYNIKHGL